MTYEQYVLQYPDRIAAAYRAQHGHDPAQSDVLHQHYRIEYEGQTIEQIEAEFGIVPPGPWLTIQNNRFMQHGQPWIWKGATDFLLFQRFLRGEDVTPIIRERNAFGANVLRFTSTMAVLPMAIGFDELKPENYPLYWDKLPQFLDLLDSEAMHGECTVFCDMQLIGWSLSKQIEHWERICSLLRDRRHFVELVNEYKKNGVDPMQFAKPPGLISSRGSGLSDEPPARPGWDYFGWHGRRTPHYKIPSSTEDMYPIANSLPDGWNSHLYANMVAVHGEPMGFGPEAIEGKRSTDPTLARNIASASKYLGSGGTFHSESGLYSRPWTDIEKACATAFYEGLA